MKRLAYFLALIFLLSSFAYGRTQSRVAIVGATLIDGRGRAPLKNSVIVIAGGRIKMVGAQGKIRIPRGARNIDARGKFVMPGLIDCHCHLEMIGLGDLADVPPEWETPEKQRLLALINAKLDLLSGVTTIRDPGSTELTLKIRDEINAGKEIGPRIFAAGRQIVKKSPGSYMDKMFVEYDGPEDAREKVWQQVKKGVDLIKVRLTRQRPLPSLDEMRAIVEEAHRLGRRVAAHTDVPDDAAVELAIKAGVNSIEHNAPLRLKDEKLLLEMAEKNISVMPGAGGFYVQRLEDKDEKDILNPITRRLLPKVIASLLYQVADSLQKQIAKAKRDGWDSGQTQARFVKEIEQARKAGVLLIFGTDCGAELMIHGQQDKALFGETQMGWSAMEAILMATRDAARGLGKEHELGTIEPGKLADLIILDADPLADIRSIRKIHAVMKGGKLYTPSKFFREQNNS